MPMQDSQALTKHLSKLKSSITDLQQQQMLAYTPRIYEQMFNLQSPDIKIFQAYITVLAKLKKYQRVQKQCQHAVRIRKNDEKIWILYLKYLQQRKQYRKIVRVVQSARSINQKMHKNTDLALFQIKTLHRLKQFDLAIYSITQYQSKYSQQFKKSEKLLHYKVYLMYQIGDYQSAFNNLSLIFSIISSSARNYTYYQAQKCKFYVLLTRYQQSIKCISSMINSNYNYNSKDKDKDKIQLSFLLKIQALKSLSFVKLGKQKQGIENIQKILEKNQNDVMLQLKRVLIFIMTINYNRNSVSNNDDESNHQNQNNNNNILEEIKNKNIRQIIKFTISKMMAVKDVDDFTDGKFQQHFIQFQELDRYRKHVQFLDKYLEQIQNNLHKFKELAQNMFFSLLRGYYDCQKTHVIMLKIQQQIIGRIKEKEIKQVKNDERK